MGSLLLIPSLATAAWLPKDEAGKVAERIYFDYQIRRDGTFISTTELLWRIQSDDAKTSSSQLRLDYNSATDKLEIIEAYTLNGKVKVNVPPTAIEDRDKGESRDYDSIRQRIVAFQQVQVGSKLYVKFRLINQTPLLKDQWSEVFSLGPGQFIEDFRLKVKSERPIFEELRDRDGYLTVKRVSANELLVRNRREVEGAVHGERDPFFHPDRSAALLITTEPLWTKFFMDLTTAYEANITSPLPKALEAWIKAARRLKTTPEKIFFLMEKMSVEFRYFGDWRRHDGGLVPRPLEEVASSRYGDCKDLSSLLAAMLRALGVDARVAFVWRGVNAWGEMPQLKMPSTSLFNHAIVYVRDGEREYWLDPTNPVAALSPWVDIAGRQAWVIEPQGGQLKALPPARAEDYPADQLYEYQFVGDDLVKVRVDAWLKGMAAFDFSNDLYQAPRSDVLTNTLEYFANDHDVKSYRFSKEPKSPRHIKDMQIGLEYETGRVTYSAGGDFQFWVLPDGFLQGAFYETDQRESDISLNQSPYSFARTHRLRRARLAQTAPPVCKIESPWVNLLRQVSVDGQDVVIRQEVTLKRPFIQKAEFRTPAFKKLQQESRRCFYRSGVLVVPQK